MLVYMPSGSAGSLGKYLGMQATADLLAGLLIAFVLAAMSGSDLRRVASVTAMGAFAWASINAPYWIWYGFPTDFTLAGAASVIVGASVGGAVAAVVVKAPTPGA